MSNHMVIDLIKQKLGIVDVVSRYVKLSPSGKDFKGLSPFVTEKSPSFFVSPAKDLYYCFSSQKGGDIFSFIQEIEKVEFKEALKILAEIAGVDLNSNQSDYKSDDNSRLYKIFELVTDYYQKVLKTNNEAIEYLKNRGLNDEIMETFRIGFSPIGWSKISDGLVKKGFSKNEIMETGLVISKKTGGFYDRFRGRITFPIFDWKGRVVGFSARILPSLAIDKNGQNVAKYINSPETKLYHKSKILFGANFAKNSWRTKNRAILVEGQMDVVMCHLAGLSETVGLSGTALSEDQLEQIKRFTDNIIIALDSDRAGINATHSTVLKAMGMGFDVKIASLPKGLDPADLLKSNPEKFNTAINNAVSYLKFRLDLNSHNEDSTGAPLLEVIRKQLYPFVSVLKGEIEKDQALQLISERVDVPVEKVRLDFQNYISNPQKENIEIQKSNNQESNNQKVDLWKIEYNYLVRKVFNEQNNAQYVSFFEKIKSFDWWQDFVTWPEIEILDNLPEPDFIFQKFDENQLIANIKDSVRIEKIKILEKDKQRLAGQLKITNQDQERQLEILKKLQDVQGQIDKLKVLI